MMHGLLKVTRMALPSPSGSKKSAATPPVFHWNATRSLRLANSGRGISIGLYRGIHRDGGSYGATFETEGGLIYNVWLQRSKMPDGEGLHHRWLFEYVGANRPQDCLPIVTGSEEEKALLVRLKDFLASRPPRIVSSSSIVEHADLDRLRELVHYIERREPCFPSDLMRWRSV
jgi:hypothetical protein